MFQRSYGYTYWKLTLLWKRHVLKVLALLFEAHKTKIANWFPALVSAFIYQVCTLRVRNPSKSCRETKKLSKSQADVLWCKLHRSSSLHTAIQKRNSRRLWILQVDVTKDGSVFCSSNLKFLFMLKHRKGRLGRDLQQAGIFRFFPNVEKVGGVGTWRLVSLLISNIYPLHWR